MRRVRRGTQKGNVRKLEVTAIVGRCERQREERRRGGGRTEKCSLSCEEEGPFEEDLHLLLSASPSSPPPPPNPPN